MQNLRLTSRKWLTSLILLLTLSLWLTSCASKPKPIIELLDWPVMPKYSKEFYQKAPPADVKLMLQHEIDWTAFGTKMESRVKALQK